MIQQAVTLHQNGRLDDAEQLYAKILQEQHDHFDALHLLGVLMHQRGRSQEALDLIVKALATNPRSADANANEARVLAALGQYDLALASYERALNLSPDDATTLYDRAKTLSVLDRHADALASYDRALALRPDDAQALNDRGVMLHKLQRYDEAIASYDCAIVLLPNEPILHNNRGNSLAGMMRWEEALTAYDRAVALRPDNFEALNNCGNALLNLGRPEAALAAYDAAISINPMFVESHVNRSKALDELMRFREALTASERAVSLNSNLAEGWIVHGNALHNLYKYNESLAAYDQALAIDAKLANAWLGRMMSLSKLKRHADAIASLENLSRVAPNRNFRKGYLADQKLLACEWSNLSDLKRSIDDDVRVGTNSVLPFVYLALSHSSQDLKKCAENFVREKCPAASSSLSIDTLCEHEKVRVGYMCGEFENHATSVLTVGLFELHDKNQFELFAFDSGGDNGSPLRQRINRAFDHVIDVSHLSDAEAAQQIHQNEIDILVDLAGHANKSRPGVLSRRPAPIQINYLGFPGTLGADYVDYILADTCVIPPERKQCYVEKVVYLPDTYQVNDSKRSIAERAPTRAEAGLPEKGFVFCCFNKSYKITPDVFDVWMSLLTAVEDSVLWLLEDNSDAVRNLRKEAAQRGVAPKRLVFAPRTGASYHLARHKLADLFLDTLPYGAHTTASDALWAGLPLLTCLGLTFPGRVAASLLQAAGVPELITPSLEAYKAYAVRLARQPGQLVALKAKLKHNRDTCPLFDTKRFTRHLEAAYTTMWQRHQRGEEPVSFSVAPR